MTDNDSFLVAYSDGADLHIAVATTAGVDVATSNGLDSLVTIVELTGVSAANFDSGDYSTIT